MVKSYWGKHAGGYMVMCRRLCGGGLWPHPHSQSQSLDNNFVKGFRCFLVLTGDKDFSFVRLKN